MGNVDFPCVYCGNEHDGTLLSGEGICHACDCKLVKMVRSSTQFWYPDQWETYKWAVLATDLQYVDELLRVSDLRPHLKDAWALTRGSYVQLTKEPGAWCNS